MLNPDTSFPPLPELIPFPALTAGVPRPVIALDGSWDYLAVPAETAAGRAPEEWGPALLNAAFERSVDVPSPMDALHIQGFTGYSLCRRRVELPDNLPPGTRLALRFEAVNARAALLIDGQFVRAHENGFVAWTAEITPYVCGQVFELVLALDDRAERVSTYNHGGILHSVSLLLLPKVYISGLLSLAEPEDGFDAGRLALTVRASLPDDTASDRLCLRASLWDAAGAPVSGGCVCAPLAAETPINLERLPVTLWDAEHPRLYTLRVELADGADGPALETVERQLGFRRIERRGPRVYLNGRELKLRGACRHEVTAYHGRATDRTTIEADVRLFKEANVNYIRTSHYPPTEYFLDLCDRFGLYVEDELALAFIARTLDYTQQDPAYARRYLSHFAETYARDGHHPSVIIWSLCNESFGGVNFDRLNRFAKAVDPTRLTKFSYPMTMREEYPPVDVWSIHYAEVGLDPSELRDNVSVGGPYRRDLPVIHDEYVHVPCYNREEMRRDPSVNRFWGDSLALFWQKIWSSPGALGGAIWAGIDETDIYVGGRAKLEWGLIDIFRRRKPEHTVARRAYNPIALTVERRETEAPSLRLTNRFCHTNLNEVTLRGWYLLDAAIGDGTIEDCWRAADQAVSTFTVRGPDAEPFAAASIILPGPGRDGADWLYLEFSDACGSVVNEALLDLRKPQCEGAAIPAPGVIETQEGADSWIVEVKTGGRRVEYVFRKDDGLLRGVSVDGKPALVGGPRLRVPKLRLAPWRLRSLTVCPGLEGSEIIASGGHGDGLSLTWRYSIHADGSLTLRLRIDDARLVMPYNRKLRVGTDCGGLSEYGFSLVAASGADRLSWQCLDPSPIPAPEDFIGRARGLAALRLGGPSSVENAVAGAAWKEDSRHDILNGFYDPGLRGSNDFTAMKWNLNAARVSSDSRLAAPFEVMPEKGEAQSLHLRAEALPIPARVIPCDSDALSYIGTWYDFDDPAAAGDQPWDCRGSAERWSNAPGSAVTCRFRGTGVVWYGPVDVNFGRAAVWLDEAPEPEIVNQRVDGVDFPGSAAGFDKKYHYPVFSATGLPDGEHTLRIEVLGTRAPDASDAYVAIESFYVLGPDDVPPVRLHLLRDFNFPQISWGNLKKPPVVMKTGDEMAVRLSFADPAVDP